MNHIQHKRSCGCKIECEGYAGDYWYSIEYCSVHQAAPQMRDAIISTLSSLKQMMPDDTLQGCEMVLEQALRESSHKTNP